MLGPSEAKTRIALTISTLWDDLLGDLAERKNCSKSSLAEEAIQIYIDQQILEDAKFIAQTR